MCTYTKPHLYNLYMCHRAVDSEDVRGMSFYRKVSLLKVVLSTEIGTYVSLLALHF